MVEYSITTTRHPKFCRPLGRVLQGKRLGVAGIEEKPGAMRVRV